MERVKEKKLIYAGKLFNVYKDLVILEDGRMADREKVEHNGAVCVICKKDNSIVMVKQFRYGTLTYELELVAGKLEKDENLLDCAKRELLEETGIKARQFTYFGSIYPSPAYISEEIHCYIAEDLEFFEQHLDEGEFLSVEYIPEDVIKEKLLNGEIKDAKTNAFLLKYFLKNS